MKFTKVIKSTDSSVKDNLINRIEKCLTEAREAADYLESDYTGPLQNLRDFEKNLESLIEQFHRL